MQLGVARPDVDSVVDELVRQLSQALEAGETVTLRGFGVFSPRVLPANDRRKPDTGEMISVPERRSVAFRPSRAFKQRMNP